MPTFAIQHGPTPLCTWDIDTKQATVHDRAIQQGGLLVIAETQKVAFVLSPAPDGREHRIFIGDVPLSDIVPATEDCAGVAVAGSLFWRELPYFESARGFTRIQVEWQPEDCSSDAWIPLISVELYVLPSKLGEERYEGMGNDLQALSRGLLVDLYGKSTQTYDLRFAKEGRAYHSREQELESIASILDRFGPLLRAIERRPASTIVTALRRRDYWGETRLTPTAIAWMARRGTDPTTIQRPASIVTPRRAESFDVPEHRVVKALLELLVRRARCCAAVARGHIAAITSEQHLRHIRLAPGPTIYEAVDLPRIRRLEMAVKKAEQSVTLAQAMAALPFLRNVKPELVAVRGGAFQRNPEYRALLYLVRSFLMANAIWYEGDEMSAVTKLTSRLFEQWCYLRIVEAFRACGIELREWNDALRQNVRSRFIIDFDRGLMFEGAISDDLRVRFRYEPWIFGEDSAAKAAESLCRGSTTDVPWCPDIVIECLRKKGAGWQPVYGIVLDAKYTTMIKNQHWNGTSKYLEIRSTVDKRQIVRQLWLIAPAPHGGIRSEDPAVRFTDTGPSCARDEAVRFLINVSPSLSSAVDSPNMATDPFRQFAAGTIAYLRREFGAGTGATDAR